MSELGKRKKEFLKAYNNLCSCYGDIVSEQTKRKNAQLKELLKECKEIIEWYKADSGYVDLPTEKVLKQIEELDK